MWYFVFVGPVLSNIIKEIRQLYQGREGKLAPFAWCDYPNFNLNDIFTRLKIVNRETTRGTLTDDEITNLTGIFRPHPKCLKPSKVLIEGDPGMGKTTYSQKLAYDWANKQSEWDESFPEIDVLLLLRCNDIKSSIWKAIEDQILSEDIDKKAKETFFKYIKENQSKVLLLLDGLDEVDPSKVELFLSLAQRKLLPSCYVVITSRHEVGKKVNRHCDTLWEILGFTKEDSKSFIRKYFQDKDHLAEELIEDLAVRPYRNSFRDGPSENRLADLTKNPLNMALLCSIFEHSKAVFKESRTRLYIEITLLVLRRYEEKNGLESSEDLTVVYREELLLLGRFALDSLCKGELYFEKGEEYFKFMNFGFLSFQQVGTRSKPCTRCAFLHKSFQEFFAGFYLAFQIINRQNDFVNVLTDERYSKELKEVFLFMSGIIASESKDTGESIFISMAEHISGLFRASHQKVKSYMTLACACLNEYDFSLAEWLWEDENVTCSEHTFGMHLDMSSLTKVDLSYTEVLNVGAAVISVVLEKNSSLTDLDFSFNGVDSDGASSLSRALTKNSSLTALNLGGNKFIADIGAYSLSQALKANSFLTSLRLQGDSIGDAGASSLSNALKANSSLTELSLSENSIGDAGASFLSEALTANSSLTSLNLRDNSIGNAGASSLSNALKANSSLAELSLSENSIGDAGASFLSEALTANSSLTSLDLGDNSIGDAGASSLSKALIANSSLTCLDLGLNCIGDGGASCLFNAFAFNSSLTYLSLALNSIGEAGAFFLSTALKANSSLTHLDLRGNSIGNAGASSLSETLTVNSSLTYVNLHGNNIGDAGAFSLSNALKFNSSLAILNLRGNSISDVGVYFLSDIFKFNSSMTKLNLRGNSIGDVGAFFLSTIFTANCSLTDLDLSGNVIGDTGASCLSQALAENFSSLNKLDLTDNSIGNTGAASFKEASNINEKVDVRL